MPNRYLTPEGPSPSDPSSPAAPRPVALDDYLRSESIAERELRRLFRRRQRLIIFDIGACEGEDSIRYARCFPHARIFAFEPLPANQAIIRHNLTLHGVPNVELAPLALSDQTGLAEFHVSGGRPKELFSGSDWNYGNKSSSLLPPAQTAPMFGWIEFKETIRVQTETLAAFCRNRSLPRLDFIHLDVQGAELRVLRGAGEKLRDVAAIWLEVSTREAYCGQALREEIERFLRNHGFTLAVSAMRDTEGDQFYVNRRFFRTRRYLCLNCCRQFFARLRFMVGAWRGRLRPPAPSESSSAS